MTINSASKHQKLERAEDMTSYKLSKLAAQLPLDGITKATLRAYCDRYPNIWASVETTSNDTGFSPQSTRRSNRRLESDNLIEAINSKRGGRGNTVQWMINVEEVQRRVKESQSPETLPDSHPLEKTTPQKATPQVALTLPDRNPLSVNPTPQELKATPQVGEHTRNLISVLTENTNHTNGWLDGWTAQALSNSFGQVVSLRPEDKQTIQSLSGEYGLLAFVTGVWRFVHTKRWYGIDTPGGACTVFCREIETAIGMNPKKADVRDFVESYQEQLEAAAAGKLAVEDAARLVMAASTEDDDLINLEALEEYIQKTDTPDDISELDSGKSLYPQFNSLEEVPTVAVQGVSNGL